MATPADIEFTTEDWNAQFIRAAFEHGSDPTEVHHQLASIPPVYKIATPPAEALTDLAVLHRLEPAALDLHLEPHDQDPSRYFRLKLRSRATAVTLSRIVPILHGMGLEVLDEHAYCFDTGESETNWIYDIGLRIAHSSENRAPSSLPRRIAETIDAIWSGRCEADGFNALVTHCGLTYQQANIARAYSAYLRQLASPFTPATVCSVLQHNPQTTADLIRLFLVRFDPKHTADRDTEAQALSQTLAHNIDEVTNLDTDRILRAFLSLIQATVRTNYFRSSGGESDAALALKIDTTCVAEAPHPRPPYEIFVYSRRVEGVHLRFGKVARGGLRWSDRRDDFRTEILELTKAQTVKNAVIVPAGAKGGFVVKQPPTVTGDAAHDRTRLLDEAISCYRTFISSLLSVTDNLDLDARRAIPPTEVVCYDEDDSYLVVAADKGTASFSDHANAVAREHCYWLGDAFASGGSIGYDHKAMGITARGAWESVKQHFRELEHDMMNTPTTVIGIGDMSGDVFGNGMLLSPQLKLLAAFDHRHIFIDPDPDPALSYAERARLFALNRSSWADYDPSVLSAGGLVAPRTAKQIALTAQARAALGIDDSITTLTPNELVTAILKAPADLLWNGGIGTYVKASTETHADVGDKTNDAVRINGNELRVRVVGEGGNLGLTQRGRIEYARAGGRINTDALDNSAGVDCSDHEVNIKIVLDSAIRAAALDPDKRPDLLETMTAEVAQLVLADNRHQNELMSLNRAGAANSVALHARLVAHLQEEHGLDRALASLPGSAGFRALEEAGQGLTSPELAQLTAHVKLALKTELGETSALRSEAFGRYLTAYFPRTLASTFSDQIEHHPLRDEIITTAVVNDMVNVAGIDFAFRLREETGVDGADAAAAFVCTSEIFGIRTVLEEIRSVEHYIPENAARALRTQTRRLIERGARWFLTNRPQPLTVDAQISRYRDRIRSAADRIRNWLHAEETAAVDSRTAEMVRLGAPEPLASRVAELLHVFCLLDVSDIADITGRDFEETAELYFALSERLHINYYLTAVTALPRTTRWDSLCRLALREELYASLRSITLDVMAEREEGMTTAESIERWTTVNRARVDRTLRLLAELPPLTNSVDLPAVSVAVRRIRSVIRTPQPQQ